MYKHMPINLQVCVHTYTYIYTCVNVCIYTFIGLYVHICTCIHMYGLICIYSYTVLSNYNKGEGQEHKHVSYVFHTLKSQIYWKFCWRWQLVEELRNRGICSTKIILKMCLSKFSVIKNIHVTSYEGQILRKQWCRTAVIPRLSYGVPES